MDFLAAVLLVAVVIGVDHAFAHSHTNFMEFFFAEAGGFRNAHADAFCEVHAFQQRLQRDLDPMGLGRHPRFGGILVEKTGVWVSQRRSTSQCSPGTSSELTGKVDDAESQKMLAFGRSLLGLLWNGNNRSRFNGVPVGGLECHNHE